jgi:hypothetical protein
MGTASTSLAASVSGKVTFVGTLSESGSGGVFTPNFGVRVSGSSCDGGNVRDRWIHVNAGRMDGAFVHNTVNTRNAYSTLIAAYLSGKNVQIDATTITCSSTATQFINLWASSIAIF